MSTLALDGTLPRSRSTDPVTSVDAGRQANLTGSQQAVLDLFVIVGRPLADHELVTIATAYGSTFSPQRLRSARAELTEAELVVLVEGETRTTASARNARVWALAENQGEGTQL